MSAIADITIPLPIARAAAQFSPDQYQKGVLAPVISNGALTQEQANKVAQQIFLTKKAEAGSKFREGYVSPTTQWLDSLDKSGYVYKEVAAQEGIVASKANDAHGIAVKKSDAASNVDGGNDLAVTTKSGFPTWGYAVIGVGVLAAGGFAFWYFKIRKAK